MHSGRVKLRRGDAVLRDGLNLLSEDWVLPTRPHSAATKAGERALMHAILDDALHVLQVNASRSDLRARALHRQVADWFASPARGYLFDFESICDHLGLDADYLRRGLAAGPPPDMRPVAPLTLVPRTWTGHRFRALRARLGLTQDGMGRRLAVNGATVRGWESDRYPIVAAHHPLLDALEQGTEATA